MPILDTDILITYLRKIPSKASKATLIRKQQALKVINDLIENLTGDERLKTTIFNIGELYVGAYRSSNRLSEIQDLNDLFKLIQIIPYKINDSYRFGEIKAQLLDEGKICGDIDIMIASIVINKGEFLYTSNVDHFKSIKGLTYKNWMEL